MAAPSFIASCLLCDMTNILEAYQINPSACFISSGIATGFPRLSSKQTITVFASAKVVPWPSCTW
jgi:hypothetical protein